MRDAYRVVQVLLSIRIVAGFVIDADAEARAIEAARRLTVDALGDDATVSPAHRFHLLGVLDVLDGWLGLPVERLHAEWLGPAGWAVPA